MELKHILARQPGPEVAEQIQIYQVSLKEKTKQMKSMASELNMYESQVNGDNKNQTDCVNVSCCQWSRNWKNLKSKQSQTVTHSKFQF